jgi:hypothetical protein
MTSETLRNRRSRLGWGFRPLQITEHESPGDSSRDEPPFLYGRGERPDPSPGCA